MQARSARSRAIHELVAAHRELSALEWLEFKSAIVQGAAWLIFATLFGLAGWLSLNAAIVVAFRDQPLKGLGCVVLLNVVGAAIAVWRVASLLGRPFFVLTKRETAHDARALLEIVS